MKTEDWLVSRKLRKISNDRFTKLNTTIAAACNAPCSISLDLDTIAVAGNGDIIANNRTAIFIYYPLWYLSNYSLLK